jgi:RNA polymerase sigma-70 factor (ECF subfamily)
MFSKCSSPRKLLLLIPEVYDDEASICKGDPEMKYPEISADLSKIDRGGSELFMNTSEKVWQEYHLRLRAFIKSRIADDAAIDDTLQNVFLKMHTSLASLKDETKLKSWLYQIARNAIIDYFRSQKPTVELPDQLPQPETDPGEKATRELSECLQPMIQLLPENYREAVILSELRGLTQKEVAQVQGTSLSGAKSRVQRGRALLKNMLAECCRFEFDHSGRLCDYERKNGACNAC